MTHRVKNFGAGPSALPLPVLERIRDELLDFEGSGMSLLESSHRGPYYGRVHERARQGVRRLLGLGDDHAVLFMTGGAQTQFSVVPMNLLAPGARADYLVTGHWSELAVAAAGRVGLARELWSGRDASFARVPRPSEYSADGSAAYLHYTSNNTIYGTQLSSPPDAAGAPLVCDMSSDIASRPLDLSSFGVIYAGAQKNLGLVGVTVVAVRRDLLGSSPADLPPTLSYKRMAEKDSLVNTPPVFSIYGVALVCEHWLALGGLETVGERNGAKAERLYAALDASGGFYHPLAERESRSSMNVVFRLPTPALEARFLDESSAAGLAGLKGHRALGGIRASIYNAIDLEAVEALCDFLTDFQRRSG
jgi:phosphoserine aminotransferase